VPCAGFYVAAVLSVARSLAAACLVMVAGIPALAQSQPARDSPEPALRRWLLFETASVGTRYRVFENSDDVLTNNQLQFRVQIRPRFKFDEAGRYYVHANATSGSSFVSSWNNTGVGTGDPVGTVRVRHLFAGATPFEGVEALAGSLYVVRGESTEITTYDEDAYLMGLRLALTRPDKLWFDDVSLTNAHVGDTDETNAFGRFDGFEDLNYWHVLLQKRLSKLVAMSADFTEEAGARTIRGAVSWTPSFGSFRLETYRRIRENEDGGLSASAERHLTSTFRATFGYTNIDEFYGELNSDRFFSGQRIFVMTAWAVAPWLNVTTYYTKAFGNDFFVPLDHRFDIAATYNVLDTMRRTGRF
jgi:hypothetical protein